jgi:hypothetical protein
LIAPAGAMPTVSTVVTYQYDRRSGTTFGDDARFIGIFTRGRGGINCNNNSRQIWSCRLARCVNDPVAEPDIPPSAANDR